MSGENGRGFDVCVRQHGDSCDDIVAMTSAPTAAGWCYQPRFAHRMDGRTRTVVAAIRSLAYVGGEPERMVGRLVCRTAQSHLV